MNELYYVFAFCALYSSVVVLSLWMTIDTKVKVKVKR